MTINFDCPQRPGEVDKYVFINDDGPYVNFDLSVVDINQLEFEIHMYNKDQTKRSTYCLLCNKEAIRELAVMIAVLIDAAEKMNY